MPMPIWLQGRTGWNLAAAGIVDLVNTVITADSNPRCIFGGCNVAINNNSLFKQILILQESEEDGVSSFAISYYIYGRRSVFWTFAVICLM